MNEYIKVALEVSLSGLVAAIITFVLQRHYKKRDIKYQTISDFFEHRYHLKSDEFSSALNKDYIKNTNYLVSVFSSLIIICSKYCSWNSVKAFIASLE